MVRLVTKVGLERREPRVALIIEVFALHSVGLLRDATHEERDARCVVFGRTEEHVILDC
jgi:hypothetical protein